MDRRHEGGQTLPLLLLAGALLCAWRPASWPENGCKTTVSRLDSQAAMAVAWQPQYSVRPIPDLVCI
jgi:hypothetical protein